MTINLYSDTQTRPTPEMRRIIAEAPVGDEQSGDDPSVNRLCEMVAERLGQAAAVFLPSGTMCNEIAMLVHCARGDEIIGDRTCHVLGFEGGGPAALAGALVRTVDGERGVFTADQLRAAIRPRSRYFPRSRVAVVEQTSNLGGGTVWRLDAVREVVAAAREAGLATHLDGARLYNAVVASGVEAKAYAEPFDSAWIDLSKGLGCPMGGVLAGSERFVEEAWRWKQRIGGAMRQAGIVAAAGVYALEHHVERLAGDHANARRFAELAAACPGVEVNPAHVETNIVLLDVRGTGRTAGAIAEALARRDVRTVAMNDAQLRAVTHLDVDRAQVEAAAVILAEVLADGSC